MPNYFGDQIKKNEPGGVEWGTGEEKAGILWENKPLGRPTRRWEDNIKRILKEIGWAWTGLIRLRTRQRTFMFHKIRRIN
jgi:hypothetical protein